MAIGLKDLSKTRDSSASAGASVNNGAGAVSENWGRATQIARPWTTSNLSAKKTRAKKSTEPLNAHMSGDWADGHTSSLQAFDMEALSPLTQLHDLKIELRAQAVELERKIKRAAEGPFKFVSSFVNTLKR